VLNNVEKYHEFLNPSGPFDKLFQTYFRLLVKVLIEKGFDLFGVDGLGEGENFVGGVASVDE
jgi:hypothetical protein